ncbi:aldehyde dehydrogenase family protein [Bacillus sp. FSL W8-0445]|jgi:acyl-CoA reductase-like NAD-dependent aldehyde dehydrogenase|uniref:Aldehyde dehydrogenase family protein n=5 Tax=Bacillus subtilis group TaxID=653685 RepID=A0A5Q3BLI4_BACLI|nr:MULTISPECIES: aldehyde dehydrogenase family protein [Bacillus]MBJ7888832.1 aldehyde dehydrogenase family protein [Bacillaceae bacterium HSR45]AMR09341.1 aldehyde dehydrogenase [Bacillus licheniformis]AOP13799.1 Aldehyde dehydrogenase (NAD(+)) [Bacillus licheniformis]ARC61878.1 putative aldehyde dehydrogenase YfmT [Bacillus licheniformis]ARC71152.1 putative aldehyde dehydrogenase YfmT [Bacillus licheniformis]
MIQITDLNRQYIGGEWRDGQSESVLADLNPFTHKTIASFRKATREDVDAAYKAALEAKKKWDGVNPYEKRVILEKAAAYIEDNREAIVFLIMEELGGTRLKAAFEIDLVVNMIKEAAGFPLKMEGKILPSPVDGKENRIYRIPAGVVGVISPFNFPFFLSVKSVAPALGAGNGVVLKPHEETPICGGTLIAKIFEEAGLPKGLLNVVVTDIGEIGDSFVEHPIPRIISFTGSTKVGSYIGQLAIKHFKKPLLELGGNSALIVLEDADLEYAVNAATFSRFTHQGQICMSANRILVQKEVYPEFLKLFSQKVSGLKTGDPLDPETVIGPVINERQAEHLRKSIEKGIEEGATPLLKGDIKGNLVEPTILADVTPDMSVAKEELFGPVVCVMPFETEADAVEIANDTPFGLSGAVHTGNVESGVAIAKQIETGMIHVNDTTINDEPHVAFGGEKQSGIGRLNGEWSLDEFTTLKWISVQHQKRSFPY